MLVTPEPRMSLTFALYLLGIAASALADALLAIALPFALLGSGGTQAMLATVILSGGLLRFFAPVLGALADRLPSRTVLLFASLTRALAVAALGWAALGGQATFALFVVFALLNSLLVTLTFATGRVVLPRLVSASALPQANSLVGIAMTGLPLIGYGLGGLMVKAFGTGQTLLLAAPLYLLLVVAALGLRLNKPHTIGPASFHLGRDLLEGFYVVRASRALITMLVLAFMLNLALNVSNVRIPIFTLEAGRGSDDFALLEMLFSAGALSGAALAGILTRWLKLEVQIGIGCVVFTLGVLGLAVPSLNVWFMAQFMLGLSVGLIDVAATTLTQLKVSDGMQGRVGGTSMFVGGLGLSLGAVVGGFTILTTILMLGLAMGLLVLCFVWLHSGMVDRINRSEDSLNP